jgi:hypothetical protein
MVPKTSIGVEIEVNNFNRRLSTSMDATLWSTADEHCGTEMRTVPCKTPGAIKQLVRSLDRMHITAGETPGFDNTGTHIHIDFLRDVDGDALSRGLKRMNSERIEGRYKNPTGTDKKYYWLSPDGNVWAKPKDYASYLGSSNLSPEMASRVDRQSRYLSSVKRFLSLGIRFSHSLFGLQHPDRRFNKYCHTLAYWSEDKLAACKSVQDIINHPNLLQGHRRHMFNVMAFPKYGTIEVRMIRGTLAPDQLWPQIFLFGKMARLAKSEETLPQTSGNIFVDFGILLDACDIHGKMRRRLTEMFTTNASIKGFNLRCYRCEIYDHFDRFADYGLSRPVCHSCGTRDFIYCASCGVEEIRERCHDSKLDDTIDGGRYLCRSCYGSVNLDRLLEKEKSDGVLHIMGVAVGSGFDESGPVGLRRMRAIFS